ncbi:MAG: tRNA (adenosine(37)-N6)-threonylcarbamoyltransferase complex dimerization subunit type 1 TsaB [Phormidesmis sp. RL_2_1]|nr:tRNA (adenosine(37)-N6)-threonylcarbamoyltransferase complex dimerization subunit type 1 TsaB [Phormidesmis sp. RL_2_1]
MLGLAIHTSSPQLGLMLQSFAADAEESQELKESQQTTEAIQRHQVKRHQVWDLGREVSSQMHVHLMAFMQPYSWQDLSFIAVARGPGGFTGTRMGVVVARTLAQQLAIPLFGVSSLAALAANAPSDSQDIAVRMPAKRAAVFGAVYRPDSSGDLKAVWVEQVVSEADWAKTVAGWQRPLIQVSTEMGAGIAESVTGVMLLADARWRQGQRPEWTSVMPFYGQHPVQ